MEKKEKNFEGTVLNGFLMLFVNLVLTLGCLPLFVYSCILLDGGDGMGGLWMAVSVIAFVLAIIFWCGFMMLEPNEARVITWFGKYSGTFAQAGYYWINPFYGTKKLSLRARNLDAEPIKVNDKVGNPVMIGLVLVWKLCDLKWTPKRWPQRHRAKWAPT